DALTLILVFLAANGIEREQPGKLTFGKGDPIAGLVHELAHGKTPYLTFVFAMKDEQSDHPAQNATNRAVLSRNLFALSHAR
ncbi:MAG TPA: hypothetical protein VIJ38_07380, partial [Acidobacteriaceae bacterium]